MLVLVRSVQDSIGPALHCVGAAISRPLSEPSGDPAQRKEDATVLPWVSAHCSPAGILGHWPAQNQDGHFPTQVITRLDNPVDVFLHTFYFPVFFSMDRGDVNNSLSGVHRFRMQNKFNLRSVLPATGISDAFNPTAADFSGISGKYINSLED